MFGLGSFYEIPSVWVEMPFLSFKDNHFGTWISLYREISDPSMAVLYEHCS